MFEGPAYRWDFTFILIKIKEFNKPIIYRSKMPLPLLTMRCAIPLYGRTMDANFTRIHLTDSRELLPRQHIHHPFAADAGF
jgi:hypothetical protein